MLNLATSCSIMNALTARDTALHNHPLYEKVLVDIKTAVAASPPQFRCKVYLGPRAVEDGVQQAIAAKLRSDFYSVKYDEDTYEISIEWWRTH